MPRYNSTAQESDLSKDQTSFIDDLEAVRPRDVAIGELR